MLSLSIVAAAAATGGMTGGPRDGRDMARGFLMHEWTYADQPYCVVIPPSGGNATRWLCTVTVNNDLHEGGSGEHVVSLFTDDRGRSWSQPLALEQSLVPPSACPKVSHLPLNLSVCCTPSHSL